MVFKLKSLSIIYLQLYTFYILLLKPVLPVNEINVLEVMKDEKQKYDIA